MPRVRLCALVAAVLLAHAALVGLGWQSAPRQAPWPADAAMAGPPQRVVLVRVPQALSPSQQVATGTSSGGGAAAAPGSATPRHHAARPRSLAGEAPSTASAASAASAATTATAQPAAAEPTAAPALSSEPPFRAAAPAGPATDDDTPLANASAALLADGPPPVYPTRLPPSTRARYRLQYLGQPADAVLHWQADAGRYALSLTGAGARAGAGAGAGAGALRPLLQQSSRGELDANGLAPERFTDQRRGRGQRAANFQREAGRISFSAAEWQYPAWPGAQDRLAWLVQLAGIAAAAADAGTALPEVRLFVADARGGAELWRLQAQGVEQVQLPQGDVAAQLWRREPDRPDGLRVEVWLDPARGHWPVRWRFTLLRSGGVIEWQLAEPPAPA